MTWVEGGSAFLLGLLGSWHCLAMCGGFAWGRHLAWYQAGRCCGYLLLGSLCGWCGLWLTRWLGSPAVLGVAGTVLIGIGLGIHEGPAAGEREAPLPRNGFSLRAFLWTSLAPVLRRPGRQARWWMGVATALFPCGLLGAALVLASARGSAAAGAGSMLAFWLGTTPALLLPRWCLRLLPAGRVPRIQAGATVASGMLMIAASLCVVPSEARAFCH